jgi:serine protease DegS
LLSYLAWPTVFGLIGALFFLQYEDTHFTSKTTATDLSGAHTGSSTERNPAYSYADGVQKAIPSVVNIYTHTRVITHSPFSDDPFFSHFFNFPQREHIQSSLGSGVIVNNNGYLLTNHHVIEGADEIIVLLNDGRESLAHVVGSDPEIDLAVLKIDLKDLSPITFGDIDHARVGDVVLAIGNPYGLGQTVTQGIISASSRDGLRVTTNYIQTDAAINPGNSGGALIDAEGNLLGINTSILNKTGASIGIGFAIPEDTAQKVLDDITQYGRVLRGTLGIVPKAVPAKMAREHHLEPGLGILITAIYSNGPAHKAGLQPGDIILGLDGRPIPGNEQGLDIIAKSTPGKEIPLVIYRHGKIKTLNITPEVQTN